MGKMGCIYYIQCGPLVINCLIPSNYCHLSRFSLLLTENGSPAFESFLNLLGERVRLKDFPNYRGGLDNKSESAGGRVCWC